MAIRSIIRWCATSLLIGCGVLNAAEFNAYELAIETDLRAVASDSPLKSFTRGGMGLLRFDEQHDGLQLGRVLIDFTGPLTETLRAHASASATGDGDKNPIDVTEAYIDWKPYPNSAVRWRTRLGAFYPPISLENSAIGWQSLYSLSSSAINTWIGEEVRAIGAEVAMMAFGAQSQRSYSVGLVGGIYTANDPAGVLLFQRGWAIHDRQTPLFGKLPSAFPDPQARNLELFHELDHRPGYYLGAEYRYVELCTLRALHYDNRADPAASAQGITAWLTRFDAIGVRIELPRNVTLISQALQGDTSVGYSADGRGAIILDYWAYFALVSKAAGPHRFTLRFDRMEGNTSRGIAYFNSDNNEHAWTLAYMYDLSRHWQIAAEALRIVSTVAQRSLLALPAQATEKTLQLAVRYTF